MFVDTTPGQAMRSTPRAVPLVVLALAIALGHGAEAAAGAVSARVPRYGVVAPAACLALLAAGMPALFTGGEYSAGIQREEDIPSYWYARRGRRSTPAATTPACTSSPAPISPATAGAARSTRSLRD